jgi:hypothetical protein
MSAGTITLKDGMDWPEVYDQLVTLDLLSDVPIDRVQFIDSPMPQLWVGIDNLLALTINTITGEVREVG